MANRYWVGGTATWDGTAGTKWAATSGGAGGETVPTSADDVYFDAASGAVTISIGTGGMVCKSLIATNFTGTIGGIFGLTIYGSLTLGSGLTYSATGGLTFASTSTGNIITTAGKTLYSITFNGVGGAWALQDNLTIDSPNSLILTNGSFDANNKNVTVGGVLSNNSNIRTLTMGSGIWELTSTTATTIWNGATTTNLTFNRGTAKIKLSGNRTANTTFAGGGLTFYDFEDASSGAYYLTISGSNTFNQFKINAGREVRLTASTTTTASDFVLTGTSGNVITLVSTTSTNATVSKSGGGTVQADYATITDITASQANTFYASNSTLTDATNWIAGTAPSTSQAKNLFFGSNF